MFRHVYYEHTNYILINKPKNLFAVIVTKYAFNLGIPYSEIYALCILISCPLFSCFILTTCLDTCLLQ